MPAAQFSRLDLDKIHPAFLAKCFQLIANCNARGCFYVATSGYRSPAEQLVLWQKGRNAAGAVVAPKAVVTKVKFGLHNAGMAIDFTRDTSPDRSGLQPSWDADDYVVLAEEAVKLGLEPGLNWRTFKDPPHIQIAGAPVLGVLKRVYEQGGLPAVWALAA